MVSKEKIRLLRTANLYLGYFGLGLVYAVPGPTLLDLEKNVDSNTQQTSYIFAARSAGYLLGSVLGGVLFNKYNRQILLLGCLLLIGLTNQVIPLVSSLLVLIFNMVLAGIVMGALDTGGSVWCLDLWTVHPAPFIQALHFFYGSGAFVGPLVAEPFLSSDAMESDIIDGNTTTVLEFSNHTLTETNDGNVSVAYSIISAFIFLITLSSLVAFCLDPSELKSNTEKARPSTLVEGKTLPRALVFFGMMCLMAYVGIENTYPQFLTTFLVKSRLKLSKSTGSFMTSIFWGLFCLTRGLCIFGATKIPPFFMLLANIGIINLCGVVLSIYGDTSATVMWICSAFLGMGMASTWACVFAWLELYIGISNNISCLFVVSCSIGGLLLTLMVGYFIDHIPNGVLYTVSVGGIGMILSLLGMKKVISMIENGSGKRVNIEERRRNLDLPFKEVRFEKERYPNVDDEQINPIN